MDEHFDNYFNRTAGHQEAAEDRAPAAQPLHLQGLREARPVPRHQNHGPRVPCGLCPPGGQVNYILVPEFSPHLVTRNAVFFLIDHYYFCM